MTDMSAPKAAAAARAMSVYLQEVNHYNAIQTGLILTPARSWSPSNCPKEAPSPSHSPSCL